MTPKQFTINGREIIQDKQVWCIAGSEHCADVIATAINELFEENKQLKSDMMDNYKKHKKLLDENELLKQELDYWKKRALLLEKKYNEGDSIKWLRENTVWEVMPHNYKTYTSTKYHRRNDE